MELGLGWRFHQSSLREVVMAEAGPSSTHPKHGRATLPSALGGPDSGAGLVEVERSCWHRLGARVLLQGRDSGLLGNKV